MTWLNAALAFAITFLILSMVASVFVETIHRIGGMREKGLWLLLGQYYDRVLGPYLIGSSAQAGEMKKSFLEAMTVNRAPPGAANSQWGTGTQVEGGKTWDVSVDDSYVKDRGLISWLWAGRRLAKLTPEQFMSRLGDNEIGSVVSQALTQSSVADPDAVLHDLASKFDAFAGEASLYFERRARLLSVLVAIGVAWMMYVHPFEIFKTFMQNPDVAEDMIKLQAATEQAYVEKQQKPSDDAGKSADDPSIDSAIKKANLQSSTLMNAGVPIGWTNERLAKVGFKRLYGVPLPMDGNGVQTALWLLFGGLLVGLGGPFWYDAVKKLTSIRSLVSGAKSASPEEETGYELAKPTQKAVDQFKQSQSGRQVETEQPTEEDEQPVG